jgi:hypothetical protein
MSLEHSHEAADHKTRRPRINLEESQETLDSASPENVISGLTLAQNRMVGLQQTVGNRAVLHHMVQRQAANPPHAQNPPPPAVSAPPAAPGTAENQMTYTVALHLPGRALMHFENLPADQALHRLDYFAEMIEGRITAERDGHARMIEQSVESSTSAVISAGLDWLSNRERPPVTIWDPAFDSLNRARSIIHRGNVPEAIEALRVTLQQANDALHRVNQYRQADITSGTHNEPRAAEGLTWSSSSPSGAGGAENQMAYTISLQLPGGARRHFERLPRDRALVELHWVAVQVGGFIDTWHQSHMQLIQQSIDSWFTAAISEWLSSRDRPPVSIWEAPSASLVRAEMHIRRGNIHEAIETLRVAVEQANVAYHQLEDFREAAITGSEGGGRSGAERAIIILEASEVVLGIAATVLTGGAYAEAGLLTQAGVAGLTSGTMALVTNEAGQFSSMALGTQRDFDLVGMLEHAGEQAAIAFATALIPGLARAARRYLTSAEVLGRLTPALARAVAFSGGNLIPRFINLFGPTLARTAIEQVIMRARRNPQDLEQLRRMDQEGFSNVIFHQMLVDGLENQFFSFLGPEVEQIPVGPGERPAGSGGLGAPEPTPVHATEEPMPTGRTSTPPVEAQAAAPVSPQAAIGEQTGPAAPSTPALVAPLPPEEALAAPQAPPQEQAGAPAAAGGPVAPLTPAEALAATQAAPRAAEGVQAGVPAEAAPAAPLIPAEALAATQEAPRAVAGRQAGAPAAAGGPAAPLTPEEAQAVTRQAPRAAEGERVIAPQTGGLPAELQVMNLNRGSALDRGQAEAVLHYMRTIRSEGVVWSTDWDHYTSEYQAIAGRGAIPPRYGFVRPDGVPQLYLPNRLGLMSPNEPLPPLHPLLQSPETPAVEAPTTGGVTPQVASGVQEPTGQSARIFGGENPVSGNTLTGIGQPGEQTSTSQVNEGAVGPQETPPSRGAQTLSGTGGRSYTALSRQQAQAVQAYAEQLHLLRVSIERVRSLAARAPHNEIAREQLPHARELLEHTRNRVDELESQVGSPELVERARSHGGRSHPLDAEDYQNDFERLTGNQGPAPEGGFITDDGMIVTFFRRGG